MLIKQGVRIGYCRVAPLYRKPESLSRHCWMSYTIVFLGMTDYVDIDTDGDMLTYTQPPNIHPYARPSIHPQRLTLEHSARN